jgi:hypothetical protein
MEKTMKKVVSFTITKEHEERMRNTAKEQGLNASALLRMWIEAHTSKEGVQEAAHVSLYGGKPDSTAKSMWMRLGKCNPLAKDLNGEICSLCWPNGSPNAIRDGRGNITSWVLNEVDLRC